MGRRQKREFRIGAGYFFALAGGFLSCAAGVSLRPWMNALTTPTVLGATGGKNPFGHFRLTAGPPLLPSTREQDPLLREFSERR